MCRLPGRTVCTLLGSAKRLCPRDDICIEMRTDYPCALSPRSAGGAQFSAARVSPTINFYDAAQISRYGGAPLLPPSDTWVCCHRCCCHASMGLFAPAHKQRLLERETILFKNFNLLTFVRIGKENIHGKTIFRNISSQRRFRGCALFNLPQLVHSCSIMSDQTCAIRAIQSE